MLTATVVDTTPTTPTAIPSPAPTPATQPQANPAAICGDAPTCPPGVNRHGDIFGNPDNLKIQGLNTNAAGYVEFELFNIDTNAVVALVTTDQLTAFHNVSSPSALQNGMLADVDGCICDPPVQPMHILADEVDIR